MERARLDFRRDHGASRWLPGGGSDLVGADGANGVVARTFGLGADIRLGVALEGNVSWGTSSPSRIAEQPGSSSASFRAATAGSFPREITRTSGWAGGSTRAEAPVAPGPACRAHGVDRDALTEVRGHRLPMRPLGSIPSSRRVLVVGDAAGLVDPLSGDGIYEAFVSARLAAEAILAGRPEEYEAALAAALDRHAAASWKAKRVGGSLPAGVSPGGAGARGLRRGGGAPARRPCAPERGAWTGTPATTRTRATGPYDSSGSLT